jgi:uroporphyrinogen decarboxylase
MEPKVHGGAGGLYPEPLLQYLGIAFRRVDPKFVGPREGGKVISLWGTDEEAGTYSESVGRRPLLQANDVGEIESYRWPKADWFDCSQIKEECERFEPYAILGGAWSPIFCTACDLFGMETFLKNMYLKPEVVHAALDRITDFYYELSEIVFESAEGRIDIFFIGDDYGCQTGLLMSLPLWREFFKPRLARLYGLGKRHGCTIMQHSCGSIRSIIPELIEIGMDVLDPIQVRAAGMDPRELKTAFGSNIAFHGAVDTQRTLPYGRPEEVRQEVRSLIDTLGDGGGYILSGSQDLLPDIPVRNVLAMYEEAKVYRRR